MSRYFTTLCVEIASAVENMVLLVCPNFEKDDATTSGKSIIHDMFILNLVFLTLRGRLDCRIFLIILFTTPPRQAWTRRL